MDNYVKLRVLTRQSPEVRAIAELIGWNTTTWNAIEDLWYLIYTCVTHELPREKADVIYRQFSTGSAQRKMTLDLGEVTFEDYPAYIKELKELYEATKNASTMRNDMVHGGYNVRIGENGLNVYVGSVGVQKKKNSLSGADLASALKSFNDRLEKLDKRLDDFRMIIGQEFFQQPLMAPEHIAKVPHEVLMGWPRCQRERVAPEHLRIGDGPYTKKAQVS